ncbi:hypothetical protein PoB_001477300 [Plakobranchus ocellatus]|uniref:Uncharacterized protein n=1 Tax=Plakobranchus ocellatus TaxID=259542 RepID=A0AAV3Z173_9GAST|nr:hypothetical protein PoB_001477300 [Plakobranchus ocellatus]
MQGFMWWGGRDAEKRKGERRCEIRGSVRRKGELGKGGSKGAERREVERRYETRGGVTRKGEREEGERVEETEKREVRKVISGFLALRQTRVPVGEGGAGTHNRMVPADLMVDLLATVPPTPRTRTERQGAGDAHLQDDNGKKKQLSLPDSSYITQMESHSLNLHSFHSNRVSF